MSASAEGCPDAHTFGTMVSQRLPASIRIPAVPGSRIWVRIARERDDDPRWLADVRLLGSAGEQLASRGFDLEEATCGPVANALALVTAMILSNQAADDARPARVEQPRQAPPATPIRTWALAAQLDAVGSVGLLGGPRPAGQLRLALHLPGWLVVYAAWARWLETDRQIDDATGVHLKYWRASLGASAEIWQPGGFAIGMAVGMGWGRRMADGFGFPTDVRSDRWLYDVCAGPWLQRRLLGGLYVEVQAVLVVPLVRAGVTYQTGGISHELLRDDRVAGMGSLGVGYLFTL